MITDMQMERLLTKLQERDKTALDLLADMVNTITELAQARSSNESPDEDMDYWEYRDSTDQAFDAIADELAILIKW